MSGLDHCPSCDAPVASEWVNCPLCGDDLDRDDDDQDQKLVADGGKKIDELAVPGDATIAEFAEIAEEKTRSVDFLTDPDERELTLVQLSASYLDADGILRTFSISSDGFDPDEYGERPAGEENPDVVTDGGHNYNVTIDAPDQPEMFIKLVDSLSKGDEITWNRRSEPVTVVEIEQVKGSPDGVTRFQKRLICENQERSNGGRYRLTFEEGRDAEDTIAPIGSIPTRCHVQRHVGEDGNANGWGRTSDIEVLAWITPVQSIEEDQEKELRADGGLDEDDLDEHTLDVGVPDGEGKELGDAFVGANDARAARRALLDAVDKHEDETKNGAPAGVAIDTALELSGAHIGHVLRQCKLLLDQGDLYAPSDSTLRRTLTDGGRDATDREIAEAIGVECGRGVIAEDLQVGGAGVTYQGPGPIDGGESQ